jgi:hypothetical protein
MAFKALFIGLDYNHIEYRRLNNTPYLYKLIEYLDIDKQHVEILTDTNSTSGTSGTSGTNENILSHLYKLGLQTWSENLDYVLIYYIGDSINLADYAQAYTGTFNNIRQGIVPTDYNIHGIIDKNDIFGILDLYNPKTKIVFLTDSCFLHDNIFSLEYTHNRPNKNTAYHKTDRKIITISYSLAKYTTDDDNYYTLLTNNENIKSFADFVIKLGHHNEDVISLLEDVNNLLNKKNINMQASLSSSFNLTEPDKNIFKYFTSKADDFTTYAQVYQDITNELRQSHTLYQLQQYTPFTSIQPTQKIYECFC